MSQNKIKAVLFDLGETLINFGELDSVEVFTESGRCTYDYLKENGQPVGGFRSYLWRNLFGLRLRILRSNITGVDFDSLAVLTEFGVKQGFKLFVH